MDSQRYVFSQPSYSSPKRETSLWAKLFPSPYFYIRCLGVLIQSGKKAQREGYFSEDWIHSSEQILRLLEKTGCRIEAQGLSHIHDTKEPCVIVANHMSTLETFLIPSMVQPWKPATFVIKKSLLSYPYFGEVLRSRKPIVIERKNPRNDFSIIMEEGVKKLNSGVSIIIFPQSTRSTTFIPKNFNSIGVKLAKRANVPIIPLALKTDAWGTGFFLKDFGPIQTKKTIRFTFSEPIRIKDDGRQVHKTICDFIGNSVARWSAQELTDNDQND